MPFRFAASFLNWERNCASHVALGMGEHADKPPACLETALADMDMRLADAATNRKAPMHTPVLTTSDGDARILVLRAFDVAAGTLRFHTDLRSPKVAAIAADPRVGLLFYDKEAGVQIRLNGTARVEGQSQCADAAWQASDTYARRCYLGAAPGELATGPDSGLPEWVEGKRPTEAELAPARANFAVLLVQVERWDWYCLSHEGHRRAIFEGTGDSRKGSWVTP